MADRVKEIAYTDDSKETVDIINLLLIGWILLGLVVYILGNVIATQLRKRKEKDFVESSESSAGTETSVKQTSEIVSASVPKAEEFTENLEHEQVQIPVCVGDELDIVEWLNNIFAWVYNQHVVSPVLDSWLSALNARTRLLSTEHGILIDFQNVVHNNQPPVLTDVFECLGSKGIVNISCEAEVRELTFEVLVTQVKEKDKNIYKFLLNLNRLSGQLSIACAPEELAFLAQFSESPQVELDVEPDSTTSIPAEESEALHDLVCEIASEAFSSTAVDLRFSSSSECPKFAKLELEINDDSFELAESDKEEKLLVKIIKANNLGGNQGSSKPYCIVEMDEPAQHFETAVAEDGSSPFWDASFVFTCKSISAELLFELYDKDRPSNENFLGLCIVSVAELMHNPSQRQIIPLQPRPLEKDDVTGTLTAEFLFLDRNVTPTDVTHLGAQPCVKTEVDVQPGKTIETNSRVTAGGTIITTTTIKRTTEGTRDNEKCLEPRETAQDQIQKSVSHDISQSRKKFLKQLIEDNSSEVLTLNCIQKCSIENADDSSVVEPKTKDDALSNCDLNPVANAAHENNVECSVPVILVDEVMGIEPKLLDSETNHIKKQNNMESNAVHAVECNNNGQIKNLHDEKDHNSDKNSSACGNNIKEILHDELEDITKFESNLPRIVEENNEISSSTSTIIAISNENDAEDLTDTALKELEKHGKPIAPNKSTLIIHSVQRTDTSGTESLEASPASHLSAASRSSHQISLPPSPSIHKNGVDRSRPKEKKSIIGNLRKKLSFRKTRSKSMELRPDTPMSGEGNHSAVSTERAKSTLNIRDTSSLKSGRRLLALPGSTRSSFSEASGVSTASSRTYINENSTLVIEINENGIIKRYLIPSSMIHRSKWKKKGVKLHLYNDHVFVAKHLTGTTLCQVCKKHLTRRPGKQGYECRDCSIQCHKSCHVKVAEYCPNSSVTSMEVEYIHDPKLTAPKST